MIARRHALLTLSGLLLGGCGTPTRPLEIATPEMELYQLRGWVPQALRRNVSLGAVQGGRETSMWWGSQVSDQTLSQALQESMRRLGLLPDLPEAGRYELRVQLLVLAQPRLPMSPEVIASVRYTLAERASGAALFERILRTSRSTGLGDSLNPQEQLRLASEAAMRASIAELVRELAPLQLPPAAPAAAV